MAVSRAVILLAGVLMTASAAHGGGFELERIAEQEATAVAVGPDGHLYVLSIARRSLDARSQLTRYLMDEAGEPTGRK